MFGDGGLVVAAVTVGDGMLTAGLGLAEDPLAFRDDGGFGAARRFGFFTSPVVGRGLGAGVLLLEGGKMVPITGDGEELAHDAFTFETTSIFDDITLEAITTGVSIAGVTDEHAGVTDADGGRLGGGRRGRLGGAFSADNIV